MRLYALEGLLARLAVSRHATQLVLKGGVLLAAYGTRRATRDIDLQARQVTSELGAVLTMIREIAGITIDDGLTYAADAAAGDHHSGLAGARRDSHWISAGDGLRGEDRHGSRARTGHDAVA
jgi:hypothetical protein